ncbi:DUF7509 family protein [Halorientalis halophila]|uniref:DUF7509 family protein n=1 Tax=Halorientalis halophila TaxID=3108499 RepID=UPI00300B51B3
MRERIVEAVGGVPRDRLLVYLMGPYQAFDLRGALEAADAPDEVVDLDALPDGLDFGALVGAEHDLDRDAAALDLLLHVRDRLRTDPGVNAFLAIDVDVPLEELDAATQSIEFALASNAVIYVVPRAGDNLGVGIETGAVLEALFQQDPGGDHRERVAFVHESGVRSAMIASVADRWDVRVYEYTDRADLVRQIRLFVRDVIHRELSEDLSRLN